MKTIKKLASAIKVNVWALLLVTGGTLTWSLTMIKSGLFYDKGMYFWGANGHDGVWHIALANSLSQGSWKIPVFAGNDIQNYHIGFDIFLAILTKITLIPVQVLYFQILPPLFAFFIGYFAYRFVYLWKDSRKSAWWAAFFVYFGGSWGWLVNLFRGNFSGGESMFWAQQSISTLVNPPFAMSLLFIFIGLYLLLVCKEKFKDIPLWKSFTVTAFNKLFAKKSEAKYYWYLTLITFLFGLLIQIKVYAGLLILAGLFAAGIFQMSRSRRILFIKIFLGSFILSVLLFSLVTTSVESTIVFKPFWFLENLVSDPARFYWPKMASALFNYKLAGSYIKLYLGYGLTFLIFWYGNMGMRFFSEIYLAKRIIKKDYDYIDIFLFTTICLGVTVPMFFVQKGTAWNTIQFFYYSLAFSGIFAGIQIGKMMEQKKNWKQFVLGAVVAVFVLPTTYASLRNHYLPSRAPSMISYDEWQALTFLRKQPKGTVLTLPFDQNLAKEAEKNPPRPLCLYESTAYVAAFSRQAVFLEDEVNLNITGYDWQRRRVIVESSLMDKERLSQLAKEENIDYAYFVKSYPLEVILDNKIFENKEIVIYKFD